MFDRVEKLIGTEKLDLIKSKTVLIVGLGGVGGSALTSLIRSGIQNIIIVDFDNIELSNLNRQEITYQHNIGKSKVDAAYDLIKNINPNVNVKKYNLFLDDNSISLVFSNNIDYVIDACDSVKTKELIILECVKRKIRFISCMGTGNKFNPMDLEIVDIQKTNNDPLARIIRKWIKEKGIKEKIMVVSSREMPKKTSKVVSSMCFVPNAAGILLANYVILDIIK